MDGAGGAAAGHLLVRVLRAKDLGRADIGSGIGGVARTLRGGGAIHGVVAELVLESGVAALAAVLIPPRVGEVRRPACLRRLRMVEERRCASDEDRGETKDGQAKEHLASGTR